MATPGQKRSTRKKEAYEEDAFIGGILQAVAWSRDHARLLTVGGVVLIVALVAGLYYFNFQRSLQTRAAGRLSEIRQAIASDNTALAVRDLETFVQRFEGTRSAANAAILLAKLYVHEGRASDAIPLLRPIAADLDNPDGTAAALILAAAYEAAEETDLAESTYLRIAEEARFEFQRIEALADAARVRMQSGDPQGAAELYARLVTLVPESDPDHGVYQLRLAEARVTPR